MKLTDEELHQRLHIGWLVRKALKNGTLTRPDKCEMCRLSRPPLAGYHHNGWDDEHALDVIWLCKSCQGRYWNLISTRADLTPEHLTMIGRKGGKGGGWMANSTREQRLEFSRQGRESYMANTTSEQRSEAGRKAFAAWMASSTPEQRSEIMRKAYETRRRNQAARDEALRTQGLA